MVHRIGIIVLLVALTVRAAAIPRDASLRDVLEFVGGANDVLRGWFAGTDGTITSDSTIVHGGSHAARIQRTLQSPNRFSTLTSVIPLDFQGTKVELRGWVKTDGVDGYVGLWLREDGQVRNLAFDNMAREHVDGTHDWTPYSIILPVDPRARQLYFGFLLSGTGTAWVDDMQLLVDGKPVWEVPAIERPKTAVDTDREFDGGSRIQLTALSPRQVEHLAMLGKVWGFLKYHHPAVTGGKLQWDYQMFRIMPEVLAAADDTAVNAALMRWLDGLGEAKPSATAPPLRGDVYMDSDLSWLATSHLSDPVVQRLRAIRLAHETENTDQAYVKLALDNGSPNFSGELAYENIKLPDAGFQLLGLFRFWNIVEYWAPYRDRIDGDWNAVLTEFIPRVGLAKSADDYKLQMIALLARISDTHANLWSSLAVRPPRGDAAIPAVFRFIGGQAVVTDVLSVNGTPPAKGLHRGDVVLAIDNTPLATLLAEWRPFYAASNEPTRLRDIARALPTGPAGAVTLKVKRGGEEIVVDAVRVPADSLPRAAGRTHDKSGPAFQLLSKEVAYLKLSEVSANDISRYVSQAAGTKGWIIDIRNYPAAFVVFNLGGHFVERRTSFARFTFGSLAYPGTFAFGNPVQLVPIAPHYGGKIVILVDEVSQSSAEYTAMAFRAAPGAVVLGSTTAGADGNVSAIPLPGGLRGMISGIGVFYPDKKPTQRIGILPDIEMAPTIEGLRDGRDELLEAAVNLIERGSGSSSSGSGSLHRSKRHGVASGRATPP